MPTLASNFLALNVSDDGLTITLEDRRRGAAWRLDNSHRGYLDTANAGRSALTPFAPGHVQQFSPRELRITHPVPGGHIHFTWALISDEQLEATLDVQAPDVARVSHPGSFTSADGAEIQMLVPRSQGVLLRNVGAAMDYRSAPGSTISMWALGYLSRPGALLCTQEEITDRSLHYSKDQTGIFAQFELLPCAVEGWYPRKCRLYVTDPTITAVCKRHRARVIERGQFVSWQEKIARKPALKKLFGSLFAFIGYNRAQRTDYATGARALRELGFDSVLYYPVVMNNLVPQELVAGEPTVRVSDVDQRAMRDLGGALAPWTWINEVLDDGSPGIASLLRHDREGKKIAGWQIDQSTWYAACSTRQLAHMQHMYGGPLSDLGWNHFDVTAQLGALPCFALDHPGHRSRPMSAREDLDVLARMLSPKTSGDRITSSEGFNEYLTQFYDVGSTRGIARGGADLQEVPVPWTGLAFHDSTLHNWWELHVYNSLVGYTPDGDPRKAFSLGESEKRAATDALYGCAPLVFPFGRQYGWIDAAARKSYLFEVRFDDPHVQHALQCALPITRLHKRIGQLEMLEFEFLSDDFQVQTTRFADGTRIVANFAEQPRPTVFGNIPANAWIEARP